MHRQSRFAGIAAAAVGVAAVRGATYGILLASENAPALSLLVYPVLLAVAAVALFMIATDRTVSFHERAADRFARALRRLSGGTRGTKALAR